MYHPSTTHNYCMIPPSVKKFNSNPSPISLLCLAVLTQTAYNLGQCGGGGGGGVLPFFFLKRQQKKKKFKISNPKNTLHMYENIRVHPPPPSEHLRPTSGTPFERRFDGRSMVIRSSLLTAYRTWWYWAVYICPFSVIVVN